MTYRRYATYRDALEKEGSDADFNRRVDACAECHMGENYAELCLVHAEEAGWGPYGLAETLMEITPQTHGKVMKFHDVTREEFLAAGGVFDSGGDGIWR